MKVVVGAHTDVGRARERNEDSYLASPPLYAVADGMGGHRGGNVASTLALQVLSEVAAGGWDHLADQVKEANHAILERARADRSLSGMGTTLTAASIDGDEVHLAHVGDSRAYLLRGGQFSMLTEDHTLVHQMVKQGKITEQEAEIHPQRSILIRALGVDEPVEVDEIPLEVQEGDRILLCSDGLYSMVGEEEIKQVLVSEPDPQEASRQLVEMANEHGGMDNITVVILDFGPGEGTEMMPGAAEASVRPASSTRQIEIPPEVQQGQPPFMPGTRPDDTMAHPIPQIPERPVPPAAPPPPIGVPETTEPDEPHREFEARTATTILPAGMPPLEAPPSSAGTNGSARPRPKRRRRAVVSGIAAVLILAAGFAGFRIYLDRQWFVGVHDGHVAIFRGVPTKILGVSLNGLVTDTGLPAAQVEPLERAWSGLPGGITAGSQAQAERIVSSMRQELQAKQKAAGGQGARRKKPSG